MGREGLPCSLTYFIKLTTLSLLYSACNKKVGKCYREQKEATKEMASQVFHNSLCCTTVQYVQGTGNVNILWFSD